MCMFMCTCEAVSMIYFSNLIMSAPQQLQFPFQPRHAYLTLSSLHTFDPAYSVSCPLVQILRLV